jgi:hypothetical protein
MGMVARKPTLTHITSIASRIQAGRFQRTLGDREVLSVSSANFTEKSPLPAYGHVREGVSRGFAWRKCRKYRIRKAEGVSEMLKYSLDN